MKITCRAVRLFDSQGHYIIFPSGNGCWEGNYVLSTVIKFIFSMTLQLSLWIAVLFPPKSWPWWAGCQNNLFSKLNPQLFVPLLTGMVDAAYVWRSRAQRHRQLEDRVFLPDDKLGSLSSCDQSTSVSDFSIGLIKRASQKQTGKPCGTHSHLTLQAMEPSEAQGCGRVPQEVGDRPEF